ncbi:MAG: HEAT repeat domain-containing protein, partial [Planctomycetota bacterium]
MLLLAARAALAGEGPPLAVARLEPESGRIGGAQATKIALAAGTDGRLEGKLPLGERALALALDLERARLWLDLDLDGDLGDEPPIDVRGPGSAWTVNRALKTAPKVELSFYRTATCRPDHVHCYPRAHRRGSVVLAGRVRPVALADGNADLRYDDLRHDRLFLDLDGDGKLDGSKEKLSLAAPFFVGGRAYVATVAAPDGSVVEFRAGQGTPPPRKSTWTRLTLPPYPHLASPPSTSLAELKDRFAKERPRAQAQRLPTVRAIASFFSKESFAFLRRLANAEDEPVAMRIEAVKAMGHPAYARFGAEVAALADDETQYERCAQALLALHFLNHPGRDKLYLAKLARSQKPRVVWASGVGLVLLDRTAPVERAVTERKIPSLRAFAYQALRYDDPGPSPDLMRATARDPDGYVRSFALEDLFRMGVAGARSQALLSARMRPLPPALARVLVTWLGRDNDPESVRALLQMAAGVDEAQRARIHQALAPVRDPAVTDEFVQGLHAPAPEVRLLVVRLLAALPSPQTTGALTRRLRRERDPAVLAALLEALGEHKDPRVVPLLLAAARKRDPVRRAAAIRGLARIGPGVPKVRAFFLRLLNAPRWEDRVYALDAAAAAEDPAVVSRIVPNLDYRVWQVRHAAAEALGALRVRAGIGPLIRRLQKEEVKRVRAALAEALFRTTGMSFGDFDDVWARWWKEQGKRFQVPAAIPRHKPRAPGGTTAAFFGLPLDSSRVIFVIDRSGSMSAEDANGRSRLQTAVHEVLGAVGRLKPADKVNVIFFESTIRAWRRKLTALKPAARADLRRHLEAQAPAGGTNLYDG